MIQQFAIFNYANKDTAIVSNRGPNIRLLGLYKNKDEVFQMADEIDIETMTWPMSSLKHVYWRPLVNEDLHGLPTEEFHARLMKFQDSIPNRIDLWNTYREECARDVFEASQNHVLRPLVQVRAEMLLEEYKKSNLSNLFNFDESVKQEVAVTTNVLDVLKASNAGSATLLNTTASATTTSTTTNSTNSSSTSGTTAVASKKVSQWSRDKETYGQTWALIGIVGDANYEKRRQEILKTLGTEYYKMVDEASQRLTNPAAVIIQDTEALFEMLPKQQREFFIEELMPFVKKAQDELDLLVEEPMVAFFDASEDHKVLIDQIDNLRLNPSLKHVDLVVVRMYVWIQLGHMKKSNRVQHNMDDKRALEFFNAMRAAQVKQDL